MASVIHIYFLTVLEDWSPRSRWQQDWFLGKPVCPLSSLAFSPLLRRASFCLQSEWALVSLPFLTRTPAPEPWNRTCPWVALSEGLERGNERRAEGSVWGLVTVGSAGHQAREEYMNKLIVSTVYCFWSYFFTTGWDPLSQKSAGAKFKCLHIQLFKNNPNEQILNQQRLLALHTLGSLI